METSHQANSSHQETHSRVAEPTSPPSTSLHPSPHPHTHTTPPVHLCSMTGLCCKPMLATGKEGQQDFKGKREMKRFLQSKLVSCCGLNVTKKLTWELLQKLGTGQVLFCRVKILVQDCRVPSSLPSDRLSPPTVPKDTGDSDATMAKPSAVLREPLDVRPANSCPSPALPQPSRVCPGSSLT